MCTPADESMQYFDLELLLGSAALSTENTSIHEDVYLNQNFNLLEKTEQVIVHNERDAEHNAEHLKITNCLEDIDQLRRLLEQEKKDHEQTKNSCNQIKKDYDQLKQQYMKVVQDYAELHYESKTHALDSMNTNTNLEKMTEELKKRDHKIIAIENQYSVTNTLYKASLSNCNQLIKLVEKVQSEAAIIKNTHQPCKKIMKGDKRLISTLKYRLKIYEEDLYSMAGKLDCSTDKKIRDRETQRQILKYTNKKFNADLENIDSESVDTGRGSSFSNYSPAYSINFSPLNVTENSEPKTMKDASTSTLHLNETFLLSRHSITSPNFEVGTKPIEHKSVQVDFSKKNIKTVDTVSSPISFVDYMEEKITTVDTASSPISFVDDMEEKITMVGTASSPISFVDSSSQDISMEKFTDIASSFSGIISPSDRAKINGHSYQPVKSGDVTIQANKITDISSPLVPTAVPFKPAVETSSLVQTPEMNRPRKPNAVTNSVVQTPKITKLSQSADVVERSTDKTPEMNRSLDPTVAPRPTVKTPDMTMQLKPTAVTNSVVQTTKITKLLQSADAVERSTDKTPEMNRSLDPTVAPRPTVKTPDMTMQLKPTAVIKHLLTRAKDTNDVKRQSLTTKIPELAKSIETTDFVNQKAKTTTSEHVISLVNNSISVITKTPDLNQFTNAANVRRSVIQTPPRPMKYAARRPLITTEPLEETKQNDNIKIITCEKSLHKSLKEIQSHIVQDNNQESDDVEVGMILNKFRLDWNALSPMSISPDLDEESLVQSKSDVRNDETERQSSQHSRSQISKESDSLLLITPNNKKFTITQNKSNNRKHKINEVNPSHLKMSKVLKPDSIPPIIHTPVHSEDERQSDKTMCLTKRKASVNICDKNTKISKEIELPQSLSELQSSSQLSSLESQSKLRNLRSSELNSLSHTSGNQLTESQESIKKEYLLKENQIDSIFSKPQERRKSVRIKSRILVAQSKTKSVPQTQTKLQTSLINNMSISKESLSNTRKPPERRRSERIKSILLAAQSKTKSVPQCQMKLESSSIDDMAISIEPQSNTRKLPERRRSERIKSTIPVAQSNSNTVPQNQTNLQSSLIDNMSISKESQSNTPKPPERRRSERIKSPKPLALSKTNSVPPNQTKLQSNPIDNILISKESQSNTHEPRERLRSERMKSPKPPAQFKTNSIPQNQMKLQSSLIDNMSISKEPQSNTRSGCPSIISNPEFGRRRTICRLMEAQSDNQHSERQKKLEFDTNKFNSAEIYSEDKYTYSYSKPPKQRISRVKASVSCNTESVPNNQSVSISDKKATENINKDLSYTAASKRTKLAHNTTGFLIKAGQNMNENYYTKMSITHYPTSAKNDNPEANLKSADSNVTENNHKITVSAKEQSQKEHGRDCADYNDMNIFDTDNILNTDNNNLKKHANKMNEKQTYEWTHNLLDKMIFKYGSNRKIMNKSSINLKARDENQIAKDLENYVSACVKVSAYPKRYYETVQTAVKNLQVHSDASITSGITIYLKNSDRKAQFLPGNKNRDYRLKPTPTKYVLSLMQIIDCIDKNGLKIWDPVLNSCRYILFNLDKNSTPSLDVVESVTHFFVSMCQFKGRRNAKFVFLFMVSALYCANYRAIIIIKHCLDMVPEILPHEYEKEKTHDVLKPVFKTFIFLLHFYNCQDQLRKAEGVRLTLKRKYGYDLTQDNDTTLLFMLKETILKISDHYLHIGMLEYSILILAKRRGTKWCHKNIVQKMLLPIMKGEIYASKAAFRFCVAIITKLIKPYNKDMTVHSVEVVNLLMNIIEQPYHQDVKEDIICDLMYINMKTVTDRIHKYLWNWNPPSISPKLEKALEKYIERKPLKYWKYVHHELIDTPPPTAQIMRT